MQLSKLTTLLALAPFVLGQDNAVLEVVIQDIKGNVNEYLSYIQAGNIPPSGVLNLYQQVATYTDDSYTTLFSDVDEAAVSTYITNVPWYSSRIEPQLAAVETGESTDDDESTAEESTAEESTAAESTAEESTAEESTAAESTEAAEESTSIVEVSADSGAFMIKDSSSGSILYIAVPALLAMGAPLLL
jgi:hypothetical protein